MPRSQTLVSHFLPLIQGSAPVGSFLDLALWVNNHGQFGEDEKFFVIASSIWRRRNNRILEGSTKSPKSVIELALVTQTLYFDFSMVAIETLLR